ncbi:MAG TPA: methyltransferase domain-containing protein [Solirubrobacterales bacterium]|nr:methyltransferase domain-containing protein [Solirubrobacterales bacterium]
MPQSPPEPRRRYVQADQPDGVPPLELTGERTLPDVAEENYWFRRHLAVYEWIAPQVTGLRIADLACGEGYGADVLAAGDAEVVGIDANPEAHEHARARYVRPNLRFERDLVENVAGPLDAVVFLQTIEHIEDVPALLGTIARAAPLAFISTPNRLTLAPPGAAKSDNPWHLREYTLAELRGELEPVFGSVEIRGLFHAGKLAVHERALALGWDRIHALLRITKPFYDRFTPAISAADFALRAEAEADLEAALDFVAVCRA